MPIRSAASVITDMAGIVYAVSGPPSVITLRTASPATERGSGQQGQQHGGQAQPDDERQPGAAAVDHAADRPGEQRGSSASEPGT